jgi:hypothetical protein
MISSTIRKVGPFTGTGLVSTFPFPFKVFTASDLKVVQATSAGVETVLTLNSTYTASLNADQDNNPGGSITLSAALPVGSTLVITSDLAKTQGLQLTDLGGFYPAALNNLHDKFTVMVQQLQEQIDRCVKYSITDPDLLATLPAVPARKGLLLGFDATTGAAAAVSGAAVPSSGPFLGNLTGNVTSSGVSTFKRLNGLRFLEGYGAVCDGSTDDSAALALAIADVIATGSVLVLPAGKTCAFGTAISITSGNFGIVGGPGSVLKYTGSATDAFLIDGTGLTNGARMVILKDFAISAPSATNALHTKKLVNSVVDNIEARGCTGAGQLHEFSVLCFFVRPVISVNNAAFTATPVNGLVLQNITSNPSQANYVIMPVIEGVSGDGIKFVNANNVGMYGGTCEACGGWGLSVTGNSYNILNQFTDYESNATGDISVSGTGDLVTGAGSISARFENIISTSAGGMQVASGTLNTQIVGGRYVAVTLTSTGNPAAPGTPVWLSGAGIITLNDADLRARSGAPGTDKNGRMNNVRPAFAATFGGSATGLHNGGFQWEVSGAGFAGILANTATGTGNDGLGIYVKDANTATIALGIKSDATDIFRVFADGHANLASFLQTGFVVYGFGTTAAAGEARFASTGTIRWRNNANSGTLL